MSKTAIFDLGNVVLFFSHEKMCKQVSNLCSLPEDKIQKTLLSGEIGDLYEKGLFETKNLCRMLCDLARKEIPYHLLLKAMSDIFHPNEKLVPVLRTLKDNGVQLILLSNTCQAHFEFASAHYPQLSLFDDFTLSYKVGARKPNEKIYRDALAKANCLPQECFYTDDIEEYIQGARLLGIDAEPFINVPLLVQQLQKRNYI